MKLSYYIIIQIYLLFISHLKADDNATSSYSISIISESNNEINNKINKTITVLNTTIDNNDKNRTISENENVILNVTQKDLIKTNTTDEETILPAIPGLPIFNEPPEIKIHDPDEGPLEPFLHPSNNSESGINTPSTTSPNQEFIWIQKPEFTAEKGSLEEKYKSLLTDEFDDVTLPPYFDNENSNHSLFNYIELTTSSTKNISLVNAMRAPSPQYYPPLTSHYSYPYTPYMYLIPQPVMPPPQYYPFNVAQTMPFVYPNKINPRVTYGGTGRLNVFNTSKLSIPQSVHPFMANEGIESLYKILPKSYVTHGASIQQVAINQNNVSEQVDDADIDTLEMLGPIELKQEQEIDKHITNLDNNIRTVNNNQLLVNPKQLKMSDRKSSSVSEQISNSNDISLTTKSNDKNLANERLLGLHILYENNANQLSNNRKIMSNNKFYVSTNNRHQSRNKASKKQDGRYISKVTDSYRYRNHKIRPLLPNNENLSEQRWKKTIKPKFMFRANFADSKLIIRDKDKASNKWWNSEQPSYCLEPIYVDNNCRNKKLSKRWSYNQIDHKCYFYEDLCAHVKQNSFLTSRDCFLKCWRI